RPGRARPCRARPSVPAHENVRRRAKLNHSRRAGLPIPKALLPLPGDVTRHWLDEKRRHRAGRGRAGARRPPAESAAPDFLMLSFPTPLIERAGVQMPMALGFLALFRPCKRILVARSISYDLCPIDGGLHACTVYLPL